MLSFKEFITELFDISPKSVRVPEMEEIVPYMTPENISDVEVHKVDGMSDNHHILSYTNENGQLEHHILYNFCGFGKPEGEDAKKLNGHAALSFIVPRSKQAISNGQSLMFSALDDSQHKIYKSVANRLSTQQPGKVDVIDLGKHTTPQGFTVNRVLVQPK